MKGDKIMSYYFNGGIYLKDRIKDIREFDAVRPTYGLPLKGIINTAVFYIKTNFKYIRGDEVI